MTPMKNDRRRGSTLPVVVGIASLFGGTLLGGLPPVDASCFATGKPKPYDWERDRRLSEERRLKAQAKRDRKAARKNLNSPKPT